MKSKLIILSAVVLMFSASQVFAGGGHDHSEHSEAASKEDKGSVMEHKGSMMDEHHSKLPNVGNAICPVSGEFISDVGDGKGVQIEHVGKIYNVCCKFCAKDFKKDPEKFIKIIENNLAEGKDPGRVYESDHDEDLEHETRDHEESDNGEHDHKDHEGEQHQLDEEDPEKEEGHHHDQGDHDHE